MKTTKRFDRAITKLYTAFHNDELDAMNCEHCAVGNMCDNDACWSADYNHYINSNVTIVEDLLNIIGSASRISKEFNNKTGYSRKELANIEHIFLYGSKPEYSEHRFYNTISNSSVKKGKHTKKEQKDLQFKGLCAVIEYLCELDNIPNILDYQSIFERDEEDKPVNKLELINI